MTGLLAETFMLPAAVEEFKLAGDRERLAWSLRLRHSLYR
jgi:hypothetical protein